jgi:hypothetical protein
MPARLRRLALLAGLAIPALAALAASVVIGWERLDPPARVSALGAEAGARWNALLEAWRARRMQDTAQLDPELQQPQPPEPPPETDPAPGDPPPSEPLPPPPAPELPSAPLEPRQIFPVEGDLHWRFGSADLVGDGLSAFRPIDQAAAEAPVCGAGAIVAVGMASSEGPPAFNDALAQCRADVLAEIAVAQSRTCPDAARPQVFTLSLGQAAATREDPGDRRALVLALDNAAGLDQERAGELHPLVPEHSGTWRLAEAGADGAGPSACDGIFTPD